LSINAVFTVGFDAHDDDELSNAELIDDDFDLITQEILRAGLKVNPRQPPKVISVLEGGYDLNAISRSAVKHVAVLRSGYYGILQDELLSQGVDIDSAHQGDEMEALTALLATRTL
jgi:acetoin utilization deacetylase AcuC-like enzyme